MIKKVKKYSFLARPLFFIFNLLFATWLVFAIESISPSDFGKYQSLFEDPPALITKKHRKEHLLKVCSEFKAGKLDSTELVHSLERYLSASEAPAK